MIGQADERSISEMVRSELLGACESKHVPIQMMGPRADIFDRLAQQVGYCFSRIGSSRSLNFDADLAFVRRLSSTAGLRAVKIVITGDERLWADNTHTALAFLYRYGEQVAIADIPHYVVDLRCTPARVIGAPESFQGDALALSIANAERLQRFLDAGWRPPQLSFTIGDLFTTGGYNLRATQ